MQWVKILNRQKHFQCLQILQKLFCYDLQNLHLYTSHNRYMFRIILSNYNFQNIQFVLILSRLQVMKNNVMAKFLFRASKESTQKYTLYFLRNEKEH